MEILTPIFDTFSPLFNLDTPGDIIPKSANQKFDDFFDIVTNKKAEEPNELNALAFSVEKKVNSGFQNQFYSGNLGFIQSPMIIDATNSYVPILKLEENRSLQNKKTKKKTKKQRKRNIVCLDQLSENNRQEPWSTVFVDERFKNQVKDITISLKTRCEKPTSWVPAVLYSSLKYEVMTNIKFNNIADTQFVLAKIKCVHSENFVEINKAGKKVLKGTTESANQLTDKNTFSGKLRVQFTDVSYHHKKHNFRWEVHFYLSNDLKNPIAITRSADFKVFARKPSKKARKTGKKRKRKVDPMESFVSKLEDLMFVAKRLKREEREEAAVLVSSRLHQLSGM